jgi:hypothetical protein
VKSTSGSHEDGRIESIETAFLAAYIDTQYHYVQFLTEHLSDCAAAFGGDLDFVLVMAILGQRRIEVARQHPGETELDLARIAMSALRIADVSGIPRETVRRKLDVLREKGWIDRHPRHGWYVVGSTLATPARMALGDLESRSFRRLARLYLRLSEVLDRPA